MATDLGKMYGPLPLGAWMAVVGGGLGFALYTRRQTGNTTATTDSTSAPVDTSGVPGVGAGGSGQFVDVTPPTGNGDVAQAPADNDQWGNLAINYLIAQGYDATVSDSAIRKYLALESLSAQEYSLVNAALRHMGAPPVPLPPPMFGPPTLPKPSTTPPHKPPAPPQHRPPAPRPRVRYYIVRPGDTLSRIGKRYNVSWQSIYNANRHGTTRADHTKGMISNPNLIRPGWRLIIP